jgi:hypothetical protein
MGADDSNAQTRIKKSFLFKKKKRFRKNLTGECFEKIQ